VSLERRGVLALKFGKPLRWIEDRREHPIASPHAREHRY
jgi:carbon-monoxide dehydrogenase large subunit